ncbi:hypothetical protein [Maribacter dokdonensis]|uniref:hypothetical protein n=1 Tax=Maribacter dokdonensis TaxID=320912 RepID=UPI001C0A179F|nr:hypothetical protein [Maribacter dokdonensis]MBU2902614.1 hypothetical protein [Maribacter dokdonensis]
MKKIILITIIITSNIGFSQVFTNSSGEGVFFTEKAKQFKAESKVSKKTTEVNLQLNSLLRIKPPTKYYIPDDAGNDNDEFSTVKTSWGWLLKLGVVNNENFTKEIKNPSFNLELGFLKGLDSLNRKILRKFAYSGGISAKLQYDNKKILYDSITQLKNNEYPYTFSLNGHAELYHSSLDAIGLGMTFGYVNTTNYADLTSFQDLPIDFLDANIASIPNQENGKIGNLNRVNNLYVSFAMPTFPFRKNSPDTKSKPLIKTISERMALTPYIHYTFLDSDILNYGFSLSLVNHALNNSKFEPLFDSGFNLGVDWVQKDGKGSSPIYFVGGTLSIDGLIKTEKETPEDEND